MALKKVIIYSTPGCAKCLIVKEYFKSNNISFLEKDLTKDEKAKNYISQKVKKLEVPIIEIDDMILEGFNKQELNRLLNV